MFKKRFVPDPVLVAIAKSEAQERAREAMYADDDVDSESESPEVRVQSPLALGGKFRAVANAEANFS